ncbi:hypothetical protein BCIN_04g03760 [Botrytis cinerea B05.10]|uniref:CCHC-type domain-containing protein n=2 Tax=Botryotinia fuckeliana TaxID=40559 RepID=A0A384JF19_BOTFB|nr:hypothetical protein BCIN_04g03760 [Botrytis cinerea B05.10]ATZ49198.1 hypothetical protein BCIN_04g03760 [Botrytis cinerea B05.10]CCD49884.1 hypothetical protein BofuT4_P095920.1 [Botrytis cinerea T4]
MADTSRTPSTTPVDISTPECLRKHIRTFFTNWPLLAHELSKVNDEELRDPSMIFQLPEKAQEYFNYMCNTADNSLGAFHTLQKTFDAKLENDIAARQALEYQSREQAKLITKLQHQLSELPDLTSESKHLYQLRKASKTTKPFKADNTSALALRDEYCFWKQGLQIFWAIDSAAFDTDRKKFLHMISLLEGTACQERCRDIDDIIEDKSAYTTAELFFEKLDSLYISAESELEAAIKFDKLKMTEQQTFSTFYARLEHLGNAYYKSPQGMVFALKQKVTDELLLMVIRDSNPCASDDLDCWRKKFQAWYQISQENEHYNIAATNAIYPRPFITLTLNSPTTLHDSIKLNRFHTSNREQQRQREIRLGLCHYCKKSGHSVWDCEAKKQADAQRAARDYTTRFQGGGYNQVSGASNLQSSARRGYQAPMRGGYQESVQSNSMTQNYQFSYPR